MAHLKASDPLVHHLQRSCSQTGTISSARSRVSSPTVLVISPIRLRDGHNVRHWPGFHSSNLVHKLRVRITAAPLDGVQAMDVTERRLKAAVERQHGGRAHLA